MKVIFATLALLVSHICLAQTSATAPTILVTLDHTKCSLAQTPQVDGRGPGFCFASDGIWRQLATDPVPVRIDIAQGSNVGTINGVSLAGTLSTSDLKLDYSALVNTPAIVNSINGKSGALTVKAAPTNSTIPVPSTSLVSPAITVTVQ